MINRAAIAPASKMKRSIINLKRMHERHDDDCVCSASVEVFSIAMASFVKVQKLIPPPKIGSLIMLSL